MNIFLILWKNIPVFVKHFPDTLEKYTRFCKFTLLFIISSALSMERLYAAKFAAAFYSSSLFALLQFFEEISV